MGTNMQVLLVASSLDDDGGAPVAIGQLAMALADLGQSTEIIGQYARGIAPAIAAAERHQGVTVTGLHNPWTFVGQIATAGAVSRLVGDRARAAAAAGRQLVVHTHGVWVLPVIAAARAARAAGARHVVTPHGMLREEAMRKSAWKKRLALAADVRREIASAAVVHVTSPAEAADLRRLIPGIEPVVIPLGIVPPTISPARQTTRDHRTAGFLGRVIPIKNLDTLIRAWKGAAAPDWRLRIAGPADAAYSRELAGVIEGLGLADRVRMEPPVSHESIGSFFSQIDLFILPSKSESFAMSVGEALAAGVPTIVTTAAPWEAVVDRGCGWLADPTEPSLAKAIHEATGLGAAELAAMGQRGAEWVRREHAWPTAARRVQGELYGGTEKLDSGPEGAG